MIIVIEHTCRSLEPVQVAIRATFKEIASHFAVWIEAQIVADKKVKIASLS